MGACLIIVPHPIKMVSHSFWLAMSRHKVSVLQATPSFINLLSLEVIREGLLGEWSSLKVLAFGGEACPGANTLKQWKSSKVI